MHGNLFLNKKRLQLTKYKHELYQATMRFSYKYGWINEEHDYFKHMLYQDFNSTKILTYKEQIWKVCKLVKNNL
jgi:hypothetical protein